LAKNHWEKMVMVAGVLGPRIVRKNGDSGLREGRPRTKDAVLEPGATETKLVIVASKKTTLARRLHRLNQN